MGLLTGVFVVMVFYAVVASARERDEVGPEEYEWDEP